MIGGVGSISAGHGPVYAEKWNLLLEPQVEVGPVETSVGVAVSLGHQETAGRLGGHFDRRIHPGGSPARALKLGEPGPVPASPRHEDALEHGLGSCGKEGLEDRGNRRRVARVTVEPGRVERRVCEDQQAAPPLFTHGTGDDVLPHVQRVGLPQRRSQVSRESLPVQHPVQVQAGLGGEGRGRRSVDHGFALDHGLEGCRGKRAKGNRVAFPGGDASIGGRPRDRRLQDHAHRAARVLALEFSELPLAGQHPVRIRGVGGEARVQVAGPGV